MLYGAQTHTHTHMLLFNMSSSTLLSSRRCVLVCLYVACAVCIRCSVPVNPGGDDDAVHMSAHARVQALAVVMMMLPVHFSSSPVSKLTRASHSYSMKNSPRENAEF